MLWHAGVQTVLPPGYLCCGYPQRGSGQFDKAEKMITDNRVLFHRVANTLNYLDIKTVVVSCGTCYDQLQGYEFDKIFPGCRIIDIHEYLLEKGIKLPEGGGGYLYHDPCHTPMKLQEPMKTVKALVGDNVRKSERCCGESGTFGVTRPDISTQVRFRKEEELRKDEAALRASGRSAPRTTSRSSPAARAACRASRATATTCRTACWKPTTSWSRWPTRSSGPTGCRVRAAANHGGIERVLV
jgi:Fe-S oxidoreductase